MTEYRCGRPPVKTLYFDAPVIFWGNYFCRISKTTPNMKKALITGVTGQDGSYLAEFLLHKGYEVHGIKRRSSSFNTGRVDSIYTDLHEHNKRFFLHFGDLSDTSSLWTLLYDIRPDEVYNLAAQSHVRVSFDI